MYNMSIIKEAKIHMKQNLRRRYEAGEITKKTWKEGKKMIKSLDVLAFLREYNNEQ